MGYMIEIEKSDAMELSQHIEKALHHAGKAMMIAEEMCSGEMGYRGNYGNRGGGNTGYRSYSGYRGGMGYRDGGMGYRDGGVGYRGDGIMYRDDDEPMYDDMGNPMGMRRMRDARGRFV